MASPSWTNLVGGIGSTQKQVFSQKLPINPNPGYRAPAASAPAPAASAPAATSSPAVAPRAVVDPYAAWGGRAAYDSLVNRFNSQKSGIYESSNAAAANAGLGYKGNIIDYIDSLRSGQNSLNSRAVNNELAKKQGISGVYGMVGRGIRSGGVMLANKNAGDSSAAEGIARAYGDIGRRNLANVGNQYELENRGITEGQVELDQQRASGAQKLALGKEQIINNIVNEARNSLAALDAAMADAKLPQRIAIEQEKANIRAQATQQLQQYDQYLSSESGNIRASDAETRRAEAAKLATAGYDLGEGAFDYETEVPAEFQASGPFASQLPIFTFPRSRRK